LATTTVAVAALALTALAPPAIAAEIPEISAYNAPLGYGHSWMPSTATVGSGGLVKFDNPYGESEPPHHGLKFTSGPGGATPICSGIPAAAETEAGAANWHGECTFNTPGTYTFICTVHPLEMTGAITVTDGKPTVTAGAAAPVGEREATLNGTVNPNGKTTEYFFNWGATAAYGEKTAVGSATGASDVAASAVLNGLLPATPYHFQLVAENEKGTTEGPDQTFTTVSPPGPPSATTGVAGAVGETTATLKGTVNPDGRATEYFFEWGTSETYGQATAAVPVGEDRLSHNASATLSSMSPATLYHFRLVAMNTFSETAFGADRTFTTLPPPESPSTTTTTQTAPPPSTPAIGSLLVKPEPLLSGASLAAGSVKLSAPRHGSTVRGSLEVSQAGAGGRLEVDLLTKGSSLAKSHGSPSSKLVRVGRLLRSSVSAGKQSFSLTLTAAGKHALARHRRLAVIVKITLTPTQGATVTLTRGVTLRS
jgi:plastocyanin